MGIRQDTTNSYPRNLAASTALIFVALSIAAPSFRVAMGSLNLSSLFQRKVEPS
ncbi:MAG: hypothetical protein ABWZ83_09610 [Mesorhizobium sp.]